jgi:uncharacterized Zn-binding protein involved in type VI secretion
MKQAVSFIAAAGAALVVSAGNGFCDDTGTGAPSVLIEGSGNVSAGGQAVARKGDRAADQSAVVEGSPNVYINGKPAALQGSRTGCGGPIVGGASNVYVNGKPLARSGDLTAGCQ